MPIAFDEADSEGIVFFGNYFRLAHRALEQYLPLIGIPWEEWFKHPDYGVPLRHVEADYLGPLHPGEVLSVEIKVRELGDSSVTFGYEFRVANRPTSLLTTAHVFVSRHTRRKTSIPAGLRTRLEAAF
jgi:YbgC/YbaW family acyl-CoA thioester hydrolase